VAFKDKLFVMGGYYDDGRLEYRDVWFSPDGKTWTLVLEDAGFPIRATHAAVVRDGYLYLFGGGTSWDDAKGRYDVWRVYIGE
jgi:hypothetical protein